MEQPPPADYPLYFIDGETFMYWSLDTCGLHLDASGLTFTSKRGTRTVAFREIRSIRLQTAFAKAPETAIGLCLIRFGKYRKLTIFSCNSSGLHDDTQRQHYIDFVRDLHRRIPQDDRKRIAFNGGLSEGRHLFLSATMLAGAVLFGVLPAVILVTEPSLKTLGLAFTCGGFVYAGWSVWSRNRPETYAPDHVPEDLLP